MYTKKKRVEIRDMHGMVKLIWYQFLFINKHRMIKGEIVRSENSLCNDYVRI